MNGLLRITLIYWHSLWWLIVLIHYSLKLFILVYTSISQYTSKHDILRYECHFWQKTFCGLILSHSPKTFIRISICYPLNQIIPSPKNSLQTQLHPRYPQTKQKCYEHLIRLKKPQSIPPSSINSPPFPNQNVNLKRSSLSEMSGFSTASARTFIHEASTLVLETIEAGIKKHYLVPLAVAQRSRWRRKGIKLHIYNEHTFIAKHLSGWVTPTQLSTLTCLGHCRLYLATKLSNCRVSDIY